MNGPCDTALLLSNIGAIGAPPDASLLCAFGDNAVTLAVAEKKNGVQQSVAAAAWYGRGRAVALCHPKYFTSELLDFGNTEDFLRNCLRWVGDGRTNGGEALRVGVYRAPETVAELNGRAIDVRETTLRDLGNHDVVLCNAVDLSKTATTTLRRYVKAGGGIITVGQAADWLLENPGADAATDFPGNWLLGPMGIVWTAREHWTWGRKDFPTDGWPSPIVHPAEALLAEWRDSIRKRPAPWAELASDKIILSVRSEQVRELDDPERVMRTWDQIADACADLAAWPRERTSPERYVCDVQICAGWMHAGYPLVCQVFQDEAMVDLAKLLSEPEPSWGFFHEIGHNHQNRDWTFAGTGEVNVNLFSLYIMDTVCHISPAQYGRTNPESRTERIKEFFAKPSSERSSKDAWTFLVMYVQLQEAFG